MRANAGILLIMGLLLLVGTVGAYIPDNITSTSNPEWVLANGVDESTITVIITNQSNNLLLSNSTVTFIVMDSLLGTMNPMSVTTNANGEAKSNFKVKTKSGNATITVAVTNETDTNTFTIYQNIDHNSAYFADFTHPINGTVASEVPFTVSLTDQYRNPVDNRRGNHIVNLHVTGPFPDDCGFNESSYGHDITRILDANGNTSVNVKLTSKIGDNNIAMDAYQSIPNQLAWITAEAIGIPFSMTQVFSPSGSPPTLPADGVKYFTINYNLFDEYGNPTNKQFIWVNTSVPGEERQFLSNNLGQVTVQYGPRTSIGEIDIIATSVANSTLTLTQRVKFKNTGAEIISLTANPDTMPSQDANPSFISDVIATVADQSGNAVPGETVDFAIVDISYNPYNQTADPTLLTTSAITDEYGQAAVQFRPGGFTTVGNPGYNATATGQCKVNATWRNSSKIVPITWKNYPYLSASTRVTPLTVEINKTIDVTIEFRGDGWALQPTPIDVVLTTDRSGSMLKDDPDRMVSVMGASRSFINQMDVSPSQDHIGLVSFGTKGWANLTPRYYYSTSLHKWRWDWSNVYGYWYWVSNDGDNECDYCGSTYCDIYDVNSVHQQYVNANYPGNNRSYTEYAIKELSLSSSASTINNSIYKMVPSGGTPMRHGIYTAIKEIIANGNRPNVVKAIIVLSDGDYNFYGDPLARGSSAQNTSPENFPYRTQDQPNTDYWAYSDLNASEQNLSFYAKSNNIRIYTIGYAQDISAYGQATLIGLANGTDGGKYYVASAADIADVYKAIAGDLKDNAGVNTTMTADFENINVTNFEMPGDQVFDYVYHPTDSTKINWQNGTTSVTDQSADWATNNNKLNFTIGTIKVGQSWNATFRLKVNQSGLIDVFGNHSKVSFNGGTEILNLPQTFITVVPSLAVTNITVKTITLDNLTCTETGEIKALIPVMWNTNYTGNKTLTEKVYYRIDDKGPWIQFDIKTHPYDPLTMEYVEYAQLDVTKLPPGSYQIMVYATASDAPDATKMLSGPVFVGNRGKTYIKLE
jgi:hypothetical protein